MIEELAEIFWLEDYEVEELLEEYDLEPEDVFPSKIEIKEKVQQDLVFNS